MYCIYYGTLGISLVLFYFRDQQERSPHSPPVASGKQGSGAAVTGMKQKFRKWTRITSCLYKDLHTIDSTDGHVNTVSLSLSPVFLC